MKGNNQIKEIVLAVARKRSKVLAQKKKVRQQVRRTTLQNGE